MNAARDTAPRLAFAILPIKGKGDADWAYGLTAPLILSLIHIYISIMRYNKKRKYRIFGDGCNSLPAVIVTDYLAGW